MIIAEHFMMCINYQASTDRMLVNMLCEDLYAASSETA